MLPSSDTKPTTMRKPSPVLVTVTPCCCTSSGSSGVASCSLFCTCTCAMSEFVPLSNVSVIVDAPLASLVDAM